MTEQGKCLIWEAEDAKIYSKEDYGHIWIVDSPRAGGMYLAHVHPIHGLHVPNDDARKKLSLWIWQENIKKEIDTSTPKGDLPEIPEDVMKCASQRLESLSYEDRIDNIAAHFVYHSKEEFLQNLLFGKRRG